MLTKLYIYIYSWVSLQSFNFADTAVHTAPQVGQKVAQEILNWLCRAANGRQRLTKRLENSTIGIQKRMKHDGDCWLVPLGYDMEEK